MVIITLIIGRQSVGKRTFVAQQVKELYPSDVVCALDKIGELTDRLYKMGLNMTQDKKRAQVIVSDGIKENIEEKNHYIYYITDGDDLDKELISKAETIILFPVHNAEKISELLDIPVEFLLSLKPYEPITVI